MPKAPVSEIVGKYSDLATPMRALAAMSVCSARRMSGRRSSRSDGTPGRHRRQDQLIDGQAARDGPRVAPEQHTQGVFRLADGALDVRNARERILVFGLRLAQVHLGDDPVFEAQLEQLQGALAAVGRASGDLQLLVQRPDVHVSGRHRADQGQHHGAPALFRAEQFGARRLGRPAELAPEVDLPAGVEEGLVLVVRVVLAVEAD